jgi:ABC-type branched-subunit amino acid transport system substrate-binding protein
MAQGPRPAERSITQSRPRRVASHCLAQLTLPICRVGLALPFPAAVVDTERQGKPYPTFSITRSRPCRIAFTCLALLTLASCQPVASPLPPAESPRPTPEARIDGPAAREQRGREIYLHGSAPGGRPIRALLGQSREPVDAALLACGNCHGNDGRGRPEGGTVPPDVTWRNLLKPYGATDRFGRRRPSYTETLVRRAVTMGLDSAGRALDPSMPRYLASPEDLDDLIAYLTVLGGDLDPGLSPESITVGTLLPPEQLDRERRLAVLATLNAFADDLNRRGGLFNRKLSIIAADLDPTRDRAGESVARFLDRQPVFALLVADIRGVEEEVARAVESRNVPLIGPLTPRPYPASPPLRNVFYLQPSLEDQARALAIHSTPSATSEASAIVHVDDDASTRAAFAVADVWTRRGRREFERVALPERGEGIDPDRLAARLAGKQTGTVVYLGHPALLRPLLEAATRASWRPTIYLPSVLAGSDLFDLPSGFGGSIRLALPYLPEDMTATGRDEFERLRSAGTLPNHHLAAQMATLAAAKVLVEGVSRCGRELSRARLIEELERLSEFPTGFSRPLTFGPNRRNGSSGSYILTLDIPGKRLQHDGGWVDAGTAP